MVSPTLTSKIGGILLAVATLIIGSYADETCLPGYLLLDDGKCYMVIPPSRQVFSSWAGAGSFCALSGGKLATITMKNKQILLNRVSTNANWFHYVDGNDIAQEGLWLRDKNREVVLMEHPIWIKGHLSDGENCGSLWSGGYNDVKCDYVPDPKNSAYPYLGGVICEQQ